MPLQASEMPLQAYDYEMPLQASEEEEEKKKKKKEENMYLPVQYHLSLHHLPVS